MKRQQYLGVAWLYDPRAILKRRQSPSCTGVTGRDSPCRTHQMDCVSSLEAFLVAGLSLTPV